MWIYDLNIWMYSSVIFSTVSFRMRQSHLGSTVSDQRQSKLPDRALPLPPTPSSCIRACGHYCPPDCFYHLYKSLLAQTQRNEETCEAVNLRLSPPPRENGGVWKKVEGGWRETGRDEERERVKMREGRSRLYAHPPLPPTHTLTHMHHAASVWGGSTFKHYILPRGLRLEKEESRWSVRE